MPDLPPNHPRATIYNSFQKALTEDHSFAAACQQATVDQIQLYQTRAHMIVAESLRHLPHEFSTLPFDKWVNEATPILAIKAKTERLLWHQRLGHPSDDYLFNAHKYIQGIPKFHHADPIFDSCPTCIRAKQTKEAAGPNSTRTATRAYQGLSIDFSFSGTRSKDKSREEDYKGLNGETSWILVSDHYTRKLIGDTRISKASPINWLRNFLTNHAPDCPDKYVFLDQGGELYHNPKVRSLFAEFGYTLRPTGADSSHQNGPVERAHRTVANMIRCLLAGANLPIKFWPYAFHHALRILNALPGKGQKLSPLELESGHKENLKGFRTFGSRVWVRPPGRRSAKLKPNSRKGIFLGFVPDTTRNILWYDENTHRVKNASHARFDEGMNDLPLPALPPNVVHLQRSENGEPIPADTQETTTDDLFFYVSPFDHIITKKLKATCDHPTFGFLLTEDVLNGRVFIDDITKGSSAATLFSSHKSTRNKIRGAYITSINDTRVYNQESALNLLQRLRTNGTKSFSIHFAPTPKRSAKTIWKEIDEHNLFAPNPDPTDTHMINAIFDSDTLHSNASSMITPEVLRIITSLRFDISPTDKVIPPGLLRHAINALQSKDTTPAEEALGTFTRRKLRTLDNWDDWLAAERKQLDQFLDLEMFGNPTSLPPGGILLRPHWQYSVRRSGERRSRNCCDGSKRAAPLLHALAKTYSSCVEQPIQRLFLAITAILRFHLFAGDAKDAYAHSPPPDVPTYVSIDNAYAEWYEWKYGKKIDRSKVLPVQHALQGHPESGRLWEEHINRILMSDELQFRSTVHDRCIYSTTFRGQRVLLLRQVDDFLISCQHEETAKAIFEIIGKKLQLRNESQPPFKYLGRATDYNGVDITQTDDYIEISCSNYIDRLTRSHGWEQATSDETSSHPTSPLPDDAIDHIYKSKGPAEDEPAHLALQNMNGFSYRTLLGELLYAYVTCRPDIGFAVTTMAKFASHPTALHYRYLKGIATYLRRTKHWGIRYSKTPSDNTSQLPPGEYSDPPIPLPKTLPPFPSLPTDITITCFADAAHANVKSKRKSTTGFAIFLAGAAIVYKSKTQTQTALSSTEAEFYAAVTAAKTVKYLRSILNDLGFPQTDATTIYEDNQSAIKIVQSNVPTERSRHIEIPYFAIQDWRHEGSINLQHIAGTINCADVLTKPLAWILHNRHARRLMGHFRQIPSAIKSLISSPITDQGRVLSEGL